MKAIPHFADIRMAQSRLGPWIHRTPIVRSRSFDQLCGALVSFKCENLQRGGAFKARGAINAVRSLDDVTAVKGVITHSSGNHGAALALAAHERGIAADVVVPVGTPKIKIMAIERYGARLHLCEPTLRAREDAADALVNVRGGTLIHPFDDPAVIAGQGTAALELLEDAPDLEVLMAPVSGGGLLAGTALAAHGMNPSAVVFGAEPLAADDAARSFAAGRLIQDGNRPTIADGLRATLSPLTLDLIRAHVAGIATVDEDEIVGAMRLFWDIFKLVIEPSSAVPVAALLSRRTPAFLGRRVGVILSGGNVDLDALPWMGHRAQGAGKPLEKPDGS